MSNKNLDDLVNYLGEVQKQSGRNTKLTLNNESISDLEDLIDVDHVKGVVNICTEIPNVSEENNFKRMIVKSLNALSKCVKEYGWEINSINIDATKMCINITEEGIDSEKIYNEEINTWE